ncbi:aminoglycoside phosphotransferase family protein [Streptomyces sp. ACT015]|uniref:aminoglycoside phosphotransferase family protein n=1 Tax=Streptomyces sp. ACT015 TaxID=3134807 RepID=UPI003D16F0EA
MPRFTHARILRRVIDIPGGLVTAQEKYNGAAGRAFVAALPARTAEFLARWELRRDGEPAHGVSALVLPVLRADGTPAALKFPFPDEESAGEADALRAWAGAGAVLLLDHDPETRALLLERLDPARTLAREPDSRAAVRITGRLLAGLTTHRAPAGLRGLGALARAMLERTPRALESIADPRVRRLVADCAAAVREVADEPGDRLLHWDLHFGNVLSGDRARWLAIDPKPLAGDPGFELFPALGDRFEAGEVVWRFDALTGLLGLDRERARAWTLGRVLQNCLWDAEDGRRPADVPLEIARRLRWNQWLTP